MEELLKDVPEDLRGLFKSLVALTDAFCDEHLDAEYKQLSREMAAAVCQEGSPVVRGKPVSWASGIIYTLGRVNCLSDPDNPPTMTGAEIAEGFGISQSTMLAKSKVICEGLDVIPLDPQWCREDLLDENPLIWMMELDGFIVDIRDAPRDVQEAAYREGLIPYIPADCDEGGPDDEGIIARIGPDSSRP
ncbi:MAG TPA: DUF6398 domain-containing protein [Phycisphaerae bacterium]|nr:DUF6398 domain-containing protein [Phycisphaerae bacterium]